MKQSEYLKLCLEALVKAGWEITAGNDGGEDNMPLKTIEEAMEMARSVDYSNIFFEHKSFHPVQRGYIVVIWQGPDETYEAGEEIISDHTLNLGGVLDTVAFMLERQAKGPVGVAALLSENLNA